jgi:hypothetical protein
MTRAKAQEDLTSGDSTRAVQALLRRPFIIRIGDGFKGNAFSI